MSQHFVYFYGSTRIAPPGNRNQIIGFEGIDENMELKQLGERCLNAKNSEGVSCGETGTLYPKRNISIVPFRYGWCTNNKQNYILKHLEDVIEANDKYIKSESIGFPLMMLKSATQQGYSLLGKGNDLPVVRKREIEFQNEWCCFGHYYLYLLKIALYNKGYSAVDVEPGEVIGNLINKTFSKSDGTEVIIHADAGL